MIPALSSVSDMINLGGSTLTNCDWDQIAITPANARMENCHFNLAGSADALVLSGNCKNITVRGDGCTITIAPGCIVDGLNIEGQRCVVDIGSNAQINNIQAKDACFITFKCDENVTIRNANFENAIFSCTELGSNVTFQGCNFSGTHLNPSCKGASFIDCSINEHTRLTNADLEHCTIRDLKFVHENGTSQYVTNLANLGLNDHPVGVSMRAQMHNAGLSGGVHADSCSTPNVPNCKDTGRQIT